jgi:hypothetical protein
LPQRSNRARRVRTAWRVGLSLAASVVAAVAVVQLVPHGPSGRTEQMGATLAPANPRVSAVPWPGGLVLDFVLPAGPSQLVIDLPGTGALSAAVSGGPAPAVEGRRIVVAAAGGRFRVQVAGDVKEFTATLVRDGVVTPVTIQSQ